MKYPLYSQVALAVDVPVERLLRGDIATVVEHLAAPLAGGEPGYALEVFNAIGGTVAVVVLPESALEALRSDEVLAVRPRTTAA